MAGAGSHKGMGSNGNRGKPYGLMLLLAFGAALLGVMVIHKLRERRIFNLLVKERDNEIISLQLFLQKEREVIKEMKKKNEDMKAKIYSVRNKKMELDRRVLEMQSTIDSLKDEHKTLESALEEKQNEIKMQRETNMNAQNENSQLVALMESLKQKEAEIEDLKRRLEVPVNIWSVSSDDPSRPTLNLSATTNKQDVNKMQFSDSKEEGEQVKESTNYKSNDGNLARGNGSDDTSTSIGEYKNTVNIEHRNAAEKMTDGEENRSEDSQSQVSFGGAEGNDTANGTVTAINTAVKMSNVGDGDGDMKSMNIDENIKSRNGQLRQESSLQGEHQDQEASFKGGVKLEMTDNYSRAGPKGKGKRVRFSSGKGKRWRMVARSRLSETTRKHESSGLEASRRTGFPKDDEHVVMKREDGTALEERKTETDGVAGDNKFLEEAKAADSSQAESIESRNNRDSRDQNSKLRKDDTDSGNTTAHDKLKIGLASENGEALTKETSNSTSDNTNQRQGDVQQQGSQEINGSQERNSSSNNTNKQENGDVQVKVAREDERQEETEEEETENETDAAAGYLYKDSVSDSEEYKEETDESEF
ncbi:hypothetical protein Tsubulata_037082 [Turnera subulata]|uniref:Micronuclear linker histone polyprotein-like protein n=1 Tax=Turnera subulata TaxID=218843 RepID=A0A9Q0JQA2_9ROSI|nr:hypothetical protein Tsubulata_037082 [Turnera subulata]